MTRKNYFFLATIFTVTCCYGSLKNNRDPFVLFQSDQESLCLPAADSQKDLVEVSGVIESGSHLGAILVKGLKKEVVFVNDVIWGYKVQAVAMDHVILVSGRRKIKILI